MSLLQNSEKYEQRRRELTAVRDNAIALRLPINELLVQNLRRTDEPIHQPLDPLQLLLVRLRHALERHLLVVQRRLDVFQPPRGHLPLVQSLHHPHEHVGRQPLRAQPLAQGADPVVFGGREELRDDTIGGGVARPLLGDERGVELGLPGLDLLPKLPRLAQEALGVGLGGLEGGQADRWDCRGREDWRRSDERPGVEGAGGDGQGDC